VFANTLKMPTARRAVQALLVMCMLLVGLSASQTLAPKTAHAEATNIYITLDGVNLRAQPNTSSAILDKLGYYQSPDYLCYATGQNIGGTNLWFEVRDYNGKRGFYSSYYDSMPFSEWQQKRITMDYGIPPCLTLDISTPWPATNTTYNRYAAIAWAKQHALDSQPYPAACTWFVSQALWAGGFSPDATWNSEGYRGWLSQLQGSQTSTAATMLTDYLYNRYLATDPWGVVNLTRAKFLGNSVPEAVVGDIIAYNWNFYHNHPHDDGSLQGFVADHLAIVVAINPGSYPVVAEWGTANVFFLGSGYAERGWTWSNNSNTWLQNNSVSPDVAAKLLHFPEPQP